jgi:hypothetical protein
LSWEVEYTDEFGEMVEQPERGRAKIGGQGGWGSRGNWPVVRLSLFFPRRTAILLIGGDKTGNERWYEVYVPIAHKLFEQHL